MNLLVSLIFFKQKNQLRLSTKIEATPLDNVIIQSLDMLRRLIK